MESEGAVRTSALPISVHDLLYRRGVEAARVEFKSSWNEGPTAQQVLETICAFANDYYNVNGGYIILGVEERDGVAQLPPKGLAPSSLERIQRWIRGNCQRMDPVYQPVLSHEVVDGRHILAIWAHGSFNRPHSLPGERAGDRHFWVRLGPETVEARGAVLTELIQMTRWVPFDDQPAPSFDIYDLRSTLAREFLQEVGSALVDEPDDREMYRSMRLIHRMNGHEAPRNVGLLFFSDDPEQIFPGARIDVVRFDDDAGGDVLEERVFRGPLHRQVRDCLGYLRNMVGQFVQKHPDRPEATTWAAYPLAAIEETVVNAVHHRDYRAEQPTKIYLYPTELVVTSYPGPVPGLKLEDFASGRRIPQAPARNRRVGELLKELKLAETRSTGVPKIFRAMAANGSPEPRFEFDDGRTYFTVVLAINPEALRPHGQASAAYLRAIMAGLQEMGSEQIKQTPVLSPLLSGAGAALLRLSSEEDDAKLEEKIDGLLTAGGQSQETVEALSAMAEAIYLQQGSLFERLQTMDLPVERQQLAAMALTMALAAWRSRIALDYQYADYRGIEGGTREEHAASLPLDELYVLPRLVPERYEADVRDREGKLLKDLLDNQDLGPEERSKREKEFAFLTGRRWHAGQKNGVEGRAVDQVLAEVRHAVVIGGPGVGKSTLTRFLARTYSLGRETIKERLGDRAGWDQDLTPIVLPLAGYADARAHNKKLSLRDYLDRILIHFGGDALRAALQEELQAGRVFLLLDGVDEIPDSRERILVVRAVDQFLSDHAANRFLLTSRPYGYVRLAGDIPHYWLPNFSLEQGETFIHQWQRAFERWRHPQVPDLAQAEKEAEEMLEEIQRNPKVFELATNPLMLVVLALIRHEQARLPEERVQLYDRAVKTLMDTWNRGRSLAGIDVGGVQLPINNLVRVWGAVAEWTRRTKPTGVVHRAELTRKLVEILRDQELDEDNPEATAESYLSAAADRGGLLEERGKDIFAFWHPVFEEFLAAVELTVPSSRATERILPLRDDPRWREVILLAVGYLGIVQRDRDTATDLVEAIWIRNPAPLERLLEPHLRLAAACIADDVGVKRSLAERLIVRLGEMVRELPYRLFITAFTRTVRALPRLRPSRSTVMALVPLAEHDSWEVRMEAVRLLSNVARDNPEAFDVCSRHLEDDDSYVRCHAALGLMRAGDNRPEVLASLVDFKSPVAHIEPFVQEFLDSNCETWMRSLKPWLTGSDSELRLRAAQVLRDGGVDPDHWVPALEPLLTGADAELRLRAAQVLRSAVDPDYWAPALEPLLAGANAALRLQAAQVLRSGGVDPNRWAPVLEPLLTGADAELLLRAAQVLREGKVDAGHWAPALAPLLTGPDAQLRLRAAEVLRSGGADPDQWAPALQPLLTGPDGELRLQAAQVLISGRVNPDQWTPVLEPLLTGADAELRLRAAEVLRSGGVDPDHWAPALKPLLIGADAELRLRAAEVLRSGGVDPDHWAAALQPLLTGIDPGLCLQAARALRDGGVDPAQWLPALELLLTEPAKNQVPWERVIQQQALTKSDGALLYELVREQEGDKQSDVREFLFESLVQLIERQPTA